MGIELVEGSSPSLLDNNFILVLVLGIDLAGHNVLFQW